MGAEEQGYQACRELLFYHLEEYAKRKNLRGGRRVFSAFIHDGLESVSALGDHLIRLFSACGCLVDSNYVFHSVSRPTIFTWNSIIAAHVNNGEAESALQLYRQMQDCGFQPDKVTFLSALKACGSIRSASSGRFVHDQVIMLTLHTDLLIGNSLIDMYSNSGSILEAYAVFIRLSSFNVVSWTVIIAAFAQCSYCMFAFFLYDQMLQEGVRPNKFAFSATLQACIYGQKTEQGKIIHDHIIRIGCTIDKDLGSTIVDMYSKCGYLQESRKVFHGLQNHDVISWGAVVAGHVQHGDGATAIRLYKLMQEEGVQPDKLIYTSILRACAIERDTELGWLIYNELLERNLHLDVIAGTALVDMHIEFGDLKTAQKVFNGLPKANDVSWGKLIKGYTQQGYAYTALQLFKKMQKVGVLPSKTIYIFVLKACITVRVYMEGMLVHDQIVRSKFEKDTFIVSSLIEFYAQSGQFVEALLMFRKSQTRDTMTWSVLLDGYLQHDLMDSVLQLFEHMQAEELHFDTFTYLCVLKACFSIHDLKLVHDHIIKQRYEMDLTVCNTLVGIYSSLGCMDEACWVFQKLQNKDVASWTALMQGLVDCGRCSSAFCMFDEMQDSGVQPSEVTYVCLLKACIVARDVRKGRLVHDEMIRTGLACEVVIGNALIDMYGSCGHVDEARDVFDGLDCQDEVSWGTMMVTYSQHGHDMLALQVFEKMQQKGMKQTAGILLCILKACAKVGAIIWGKLLHYLVVVDGFESDWAIIATLIFLYAECGYMIEVHKVFHSLPSPDLATWSVLIAHCGSMDLTRQLFTSMKQQNLNPNAQLFTNILTACAREGLLEEGESYFEIMREGDGIVSNLWHFTSMANLLSRTGHTKDAYDLLQALPMPPDKAIWRALLSGCKLHEDVCLGERSFDHGINGIDRNVILKVQLSKEVLLSKLTEKSEVTLNDQVHWEIGCREKSEEQYLIIEELYLLKQKNSFIQTLE